MILWLLMVSSLAQPLTYMTFATNAECVSMGQSITDIVSDTTKAVRTFECKEVLNFPRRESDP